MRCRDIQRRFALAKKRRIAAERELKAANKRIAAIAERAGRGRPRADSQSRWREDYDLHNPVSPALKRAYKAALDRSQKAQTAAWSSADEMRNASAMSQSKGCGWLSGVKAKRKRRG